MIRRFSVLIMLFLFTLSSYGQTVGEQFYVFRSNGQVNGFIPNEVNSIEFSNVDIDGNSYDEIVTQIIRTIDSVYTIPLAEIDSISFVKPKTEYQPDVVNISDQLMSYVVSCDSLTITFSNSTPSSLLPKVGTKLVSMEMNDKFPYGFAGEVIEVNNLNSGYSVGCTLASLEDIFVTYYNTVSAYGYYKDENALSRQSFKSRASIVPYGNWYNNPTDWGINQDMHLNKETINFGYELDMHRRRNDDIKGDLKTEFSLGVIPNIHVVSTMIIRRGEGFYFMASISGNVIIEEQLSFSGGIDWQHDIPFGQIAVPIPQCPIIQFYFQPGLFFNANANLSANAKWTQEFTFGSAFELSSRGNEAITPSVNGHMVSSDFDIEGSLDGKFGVGLYMETGFNVMSRDIINACIRGEIGAEFVGNFILNNNDIAQAEQNTETYNRLKESYFEVNAFTNALSEHRTGRWGRVNSINPWNINYNIKTWDLVPTFSNVSLEQQKNSLTSAEASIDISGDCLFPVEIGMSLRTENGEEVDRIFANTRFTNGNKQYNHTFDNLYSSDNYVLYPIVNFLGNEILASPSSAVEMKDYPVSITDFSQTGAYFDKDGYTYNGQTYSYKYNCSVSVEITDNTDVEEWGVVYEDTEGKSSKVSSKSYYSPYVSELIVYRNEEKSTVRLREFVKYIDDDELYYGDYKDYEVSYNDKEKTQIPVSITDFSQTGAYFDKDGYTYNGQTYSYKYNCSVSVEITDNTDVEDWGYVYEDPYGQKKLLSLKALANYIDNCAYYSDTRNVYYRNESKSTIRLYGFVKYTGDDNYYYGNPTDYIVSYQEEGLTSCPDNNHPHMIDLGLPSGTKWSCCNIGANSPENYGNYYSWGETETKNVFVELTYKFYHYSGDYWMYDFEFEYIGDNISGTKYDAATVKWGSFWKMPTTTQIDELIRYTNCKEATQNGVKGTVITGRNGGTIFVPFTGMYVGDVGDDSFINGHCHKSELQWEGSSGHFWIASRDYVYENSNYEMQNMFSWLSAHFETYGSGCRIQVADRSNGLPIRAVHR